MPRISLDGRRKIYDGILRNVKMYAAMNDVTKERIALALHCSSMTVYNRFREPEKLTVEELLALANLFNVTLLTLVDVKTS